ncbi:MAG: transposase, partial [Eubacteriales bacterium]
MPRGSRFDVPNILQHVIVRGIEKSPIFITDGDRLDFLCRFSRLLIETGTSCLAWALLSNHFHLLVRPMQKPLSNFMQRLLTGYAVSFNRRHDRAGHLCQNRYKSFVCEDEVYLLQLVRYIHLNPLRAGIVKTIEELDVYPWSGHGAIIGKSQIN